MTTNTLSLAGQTALVTGGSSGIGAGIARALGAAGARVAVNYSHSADGAEQVRRDIEAAGGEALCVQADVSDEAAVKAMFATVCDAWGALDILVNNAGIQQDAPLLEMSLADWRKVIAVNLDGQFLCAREAARLFVRQGVVEGRSRAAGKIICISSVHQAIPWAGHVNYAASKGGVAMLMKTMAQELAPQRVRVNAIAPGAIRTDINRDAWDDQASRDKLLQLIPYGRIGDTDDIAAAALWLASDASDYMTGETLFIDGGMMLYPGFRDGG